MMTRTAPANSFSLRDFAAIGASFFVLSTAAYGLSSDSASVTPAANVLHRAQSEDNAHRFGQMLDRVDVKPTSVASILPVETPAAVAPIVEQAAAAPVVAPAEAARIEPPLPKKIEIAAAMPIVDPAQIIKTQPIAQWQPLKKTPQKAVETQSKLVAPYVRKLNSAAPKSAQAWIRKGKSYLRAYGIRF